MMFDLCRVKLKGRTGVYCQSDGTHNLLSCTCREVYRQPVQFI